MDLKRGIEGCLGVALLQELERIEKPAAADIAHVSVRAEVLAQALLQVLPLCADVCEQAFILNDPLYLEGGRAGYGVCLVRMSVYERAGTGTQDGNDVFGNQDPGNRLVAAPSPLPMAWMSGVTDSCSQAWRLPVRPVPHMISSRISSAP